MALDDSNLGVSISYHGCQQGQGRQALIKWAYGIALCEECYKALSYGASVFLKLSTPMNTWLTRELFHL